MGREWRWASNPEFLREGSAIADSLYPDRIVLDAEEECTLQALRELYRPLVAQSFEAPAFLPRPAAVTQVPVVTTTLTSAEMIKYSANAVLAVKIGFANEVANICERVGAEAPGGHGRHRAGRPHWSALRQSRLGLGR